MTSHILKSYDEELDQLKTMVSQMGGLAEEQLDKALRALNGGDVKLIEEVETSDTILDQMERDVEQLSMTMFARRAPLADDLREIVAAIKMTTLIERMGDHAKNIGKRARDMINEGAFTVPPLLTTMADEARGMISNVMDAYVRRDADAAIAVWEHDEHLDSLHSAASRDIISRMMEQPETLNFMTHHLMIAKNLERIGDQATNVAELVHYAITGKELDQRMTSGDGLQPALASDQKDDQ